MEDSIGPDSRVRICDKCGGRVFAVYTNYCVRCLVCGHEQSIRRDGRKSAQHKIDRAMVLLGEGMGVNKVAKTVGLSPMTVSRLRRKLIGIT